MQHTVESMKADIEEVKVRINSAKTEQNAITSKVADEMSTHCEEIKVLTAANRKLQATNCDLFQTLNRLESYSRRSSLIFSNVEEDHAPIINSVRGTFMGVSFILAA